MNKVLLFLFLLSLCVSAQTFKVEKVTGKVSALKGTSENWTDVKTGDKLQGSDLIATNENSYVQISQNGSSFLLKSNSALGLNRIKKLSVDELLLALAMEDIKNVPKNKSNIKTRSTAVYGAEISGKQNKLIPANDLGSKKINGARQLAENGFKESSVLAAKETFSKYPETQKSVSDRIYFADIFEKLGLFDEAYSEYLNISNLTMNNDQKNIVQGKISLLSKKISK